MYGRQRGWDPRVQLPLDMEQKPSKMHRSVEEADAMAWHDSQNGSLVVGRLQAE